MNDRRRATSPELADWAAWVAPLELIQRKLHIATKADTMVGLFDGSNREWLDRCHRAVEEARARLGLDGEPAGAVLALPSDITKYEPAGAGADELKAWAAGAVGLSPALREEQRQAKIAELKQEGKWHAPARLVDAYLAEAVGAAQEAPASGLVADVEPWDEEVDGARLLDELAETFARYVALPEAGAETLALYTVLTYAPDDFFVLPILALLSAVKRSGKTTALTVLANLVARPLPGSNITASALFRAVDACRPTLLIDEADSFLADNEEMRGVLNSGHTRATAYVIRSVPVGDGYEAKQFAVWCPKIVAGIGKLATTLEDRSIIIRMRRRAPGERVDRLRLGRLSELEPLARRCRRWADDHHAVLAPADPEMPALASDRATDNWRPLVAIADAAGGEWSERARRAAAALSGTDETDGATVQLLADLRDLFRERQTERLTSADVVAALGAMEDRPWPEWRHGKPITTRQLASLLKSFAIKPKVMRVADGTPRGYEAGDFTDAWNRYLPPSPPGICATSATSLQNGTFQSATADEGVAHENPVICRDVSDVAGRSPFGGEDGPVEGLPDDTDDLPDDFDDDLAIPFVAGGTLEKAARIAVDTGAVSRVLLERRLDLYEAEACQVLDHLEALGIIGSGNGAARSVLVDDEGLDRLLESQHIERGEP